MVTAVDEEVVEEKAARLRVPEVLRVLLVELERCKEDEVPKKRGDLQIVRARARGTPSEDEDAQIDAQDDTDGMVVCVDVRNLLDHTR